MADARFRWRLAWQAVRTLWRLDHDQYVRGEQPPAARACGRSLTEYPREGSAAWGALDARPLDVDRLEHRQRRPAIGYRRIRYRRLPLAELEGRCPDCRWPYREDGCAPGLCSQVAF